MKPIDSYVVYIEKGDRAYVVTGQDPQQRPWPTHVIHDGKLFKFGREESMPDWMEGKGVKGHASYTWIPSKGRKSGPAKMSTIF